MSEKKKINIIDIAIILVVVAAIAVAAVLIGAGSSAPSAAQTKTVILEVTEKTENFASVPKKDDIILDAATKQEIGRLVSVKKEQGYINTTNVQEGKIVKSEIPERYSVYLTIELHSMTDSAKIGKSMYIQGRTYACSGYIVDIVESKEAKQ